MANANAAGAAMSALLMLSLGWTLLPVSLLLARPATTQLPVHRPNCTPRPYTRALLPASTTIYATTANDDGPPTKVGSTTKVGPTKKVSQERRRLQRANWPPPMVLAPMRTPPPRPLAATHHERAALLITSSPKTHMLRRYPTNYLVSRTRIGCPVAMRLRPNPTASLPNRTPNLPNRTEHRTYPTEHRAYGNLCPKLPYPSLKLSYQAPTQAILNRSQTFPVTNSPYYPNDLVRRTQSL